jgi:hypothetical protein
MADLIFLSGSPTQQPFSGVDGSQVDFNGNPDFINPAYFFYATFPSLNLPPISSDKPVLLRLFGWINGG